jgi:hypothetical protein
MRDGNRMRDIEQELPRLEGGSAAHRNLTERPSVFRTRDATRQEEQRERETRRTGFAKVREEEERKRQRTRVLERERVEAEARQIRTRFLHE